MSRYEFEFKLVAVAHNESDTDFRNCDGISVDVAQSVCDAWNDIQSDYHNFSLKKK